MELSTNGVYPDRTHLGWRFLCEATKLSGMQMPLMNKEDVSMDCIARELGGMLNVADTGESNHGESCEGKDDKLTGEEGAGAAEHCAVAMELSTDPAKE